MMSATPHNLTLHKRTKENNGKVFSRFKCKCRYFSSFSKQNPGTTRGRHQWNLITYCDNYYYNMLFCFGFASLFPIGVRMK